LGLDPWDVFHQGLARHLGMAIGTVLIIVGALVLLVWIPLRQRPGFGTISNVVMIGVSLNLSLQWLPSQHVVAWALTYMGTGIVLCGVATGMYIGANHGPGPRDGLMTGLAARTGGSIRLVRTGIELTVLVAGGLLGGTLGIGTVLFALAIGPLTQVFLPLFEVRARPAASSRPVSTNDNDAARAR
jgi:uncharacterized membrane protein YczE